MPFASVFSVCGGSTTGPGDGFSWNFQNLTCAIMTKQEERWGILRFSIHPVPAIDFKRLGGAVVTHWPLTATARVLLGLWAACGMSFTLHSQCLVVFPSGVFFYPQRGLKLFCFEPSHKANRPGQNLSMALPFYIALCIAFVKSGPRIHPDTPTAYHS